ncbi:hypothetical protein [Azohydromonas australica]|uniref:hypothetical protein n=1 Tax=Azohydromonas australica TaxID=364039 RepID=UPI00068641F6|nr:hypothetical protein [Azohydromonas australica]
MNASFSRFVLLSTMLCAGPAVVDRLARAEERPAAAAGALPQMAADAILRALGLADTAAASPAPMPARSVLAEMLSATTAQPSTAAPTQPASGNDPSSIKTASATLQVLQLQGLMPTHAQAGAAAVPSSTPLAAAALAPAALPAPMPQSGADTPAVNLAAAEVLLETATPAVAVIPAPTPLQLAQRTLVALDETALDTLRGGFVGDGGLRISFGIERAVYVNGSLVTTTSLNLSELGTLSAGKAAAMKLPEVGNRIALIQNGAGNAVLTSLGPRAIGTVIQNTLDGQKIQTLTTINATANSLGVLKSIEAQRNLRSAITDSLRR